MDRKTDVDSIWKVLGQTGRYQVFQVIILIIDIIPWALHTFSFVFSGYRPDFRCNEENNTSVAHEGNDSNVLDIEYGMCWVNVHNNASNTTHSCMNGLNYSVPKTTTIITQYDLVCEREALGELTQTILILGEGIGAAIFAPLADKYGRKTTHVACHIALLVVGISIAFAPNYTVFIILKLIIGIVIEGFGLTGIILLLEIFPKEIRANGYWFGVISWTTGCIILAPLGYFFRDLSWRYMQIAISLVSVYSIAEIWILDESLRWLIANDKKDKAERIIKKAAKINRKNADDVFNVIEVMDECDKPDELQNLPRREEIVWKHDSITSDEEKPTVDNIKIKTVMGQKEQSSPIQILTNKHLFVTCLITCYVWIVSTLTYYSLFLISSQLAGNRFLNYFLNGIIEYPAYLIIYGTINRLGRRKTCSIFQSIVTISLIIASILSTISEGNPAIQTTITVFSLIGKLGITGSFSVIFMYTPELYPTNLRNTGMGMSSLISRVGGMLAPFSMNLYRRAAWAPGAIFGVMSLFAIFLLMLLPETGSVELPQSTEEVNQWYKDRKMRKKRKT